METLYNAPVRTLNNTIDSTGDILLSDFVTVPGLGDIRVRLELVSILQTGSYVVISGLWNNGPTSSGVMASFYNIWDTPGNYELGFSRGDKDNTTRVIGTMYVVGRVRAGLEILATEQGEDIPEWL